MKNRFTKTVTAFIAAFLMITAVTTNVAWAAPSVPNEYTVGTLNSLLAQKDRWKFFYKGGSIKNGTLQMDYRNGAVSGEAIASPMVQLQKNQLIKFTYNSPFSTGALLQSYAMFEFRLPLGDRHTGIQEQYYAFLIAPGAEFKNVWLCYSKEGMAPGGKAIKFSHKIEKDTDYVITCGTVETANGIRILLYIDDTCVIDLEDTSDDKKIEGDPLTKGKYISPYNFNFYTMKDDYVIKGAEGTPLDLSKTKVDVLPEYDEDTNRPIIKPSTASSSPSAASTPAASSRPSAGTESTVSSTSTANSTPSAAGSAPEESTVTPESQPTEASEQTLSPSSAQQAGSEEPDKKSPVGLIAAIVVIVVLLAGAGAVIYFVRTKKADKQ